MFPLFETICVERGKILHLHYHQRRYQEAYMRYWGKKPATTITDGFILPKYCDVGKYKLRIGYNEFAKKAEIEPYTFKHIERLKIVVADNLDYSLKYSNRTELISLLQQKQDCHDVLIIKNGMVTDSSFCNIVFFDGCTWFTPSTPLLKGTARTRLLERGSIKEAAITIDEIKKFHSFRLINAMRHFDELEPVAVDRIIF